MNASRLVVRRFTAVPPEARRPGGEPPNYKPGEAAVRSRHGMFQGGPRLDVPEALGAIELERRGVLGVHADERLVRSLPPQIRKRRPQQRPPDPLPTELRMHPQPVDQTASRRPRTPDAEPDAAPCRPRDED